MKPLGTILPTAQSMEASRSFHEQDTANRKAAAIRHGLSKYPCHYIGGEYRYYNGPCKYAVIGRDMLPKWFEVRADGDYAIPARRVSR